jgi:hypothetical protein
MWLVTNRTRFAAERSWVQDRDANKIWLVAIKATFDVQPDGSCRLSEQQVPVFRVGQPYGKPGESSLAYDGDLLGVRPCTDVLVKGSAWTPEGRPAASVDVQVVVGPVRKRLRVFGDRVWERGPAGAVAASRAVEFESMPIIFERAYGGWDRTADDPAEHRLEERNPVGTGFAIRAEHCRDKRLPNIEYPDQLIGSWKDRPAPAGLNAIECHWSGRRELAGTYDEGWRRSRFPLWALDFDPRYHNCAPPDQRAPGYLAGGETVDLINLTANGRLRFALPVVQLTVETRFGRERIEHGANLAAVILEPDVPRVLLVWQASLVCNHRVDELDETVVAERSAI